MKKALQILAMLLITTALWAQSPQKMSYQSIVRDVSNNLVTEQEVGMQISILQGSMLGAAVYVEKQLPATNSNGLLSIEIGTGDVQYGVFSAIDWSDGPYFIETEIDLEGGDAYSISGVTQLMSVPYALYAEKSNIVGDEPAFDGWDKDVSDDFDGDYSMLTNAPTNVSEFINDAGYITSVPSQSLGIELTNTSYGMWVISPSLEFRGRLYDSDDNPMNGVLSIGFSLFQNGSGGSALWTEVYTVACTDGFFSIKLGDTTPLSPDLFENNSEIWTEITIGGEAFDQRVMLERVGKSLYAEKAGEVDYSNVTGAPANVSTFTNDAGYLTTDLWTENASDVYRASGNVGIGTVSPAYNLDVSGTTRITGEVDRPAMDVSFYAKNNVSDAKSSSGWFKVEFNLETHDDGSNYSNTLDRFVAPEAGVYHLSASVGLDNLGDGSRIAVAFYVNGSSSVRFGSGYAYGGNYQQISGSATIKLNSGDYVEVYVYTDDSSFIIDGTLYTNFSGHRVY